MLSKSACGVCETKYNSLQKNHMPAETCLLTSEENLAKTQNCCFELAGLTCEHVGCVCRGQVCQENSENQTVSESVH